MARMNKIGGGLLGIAALLMASMAVGQNAPRAIQLKSFPAEFLTNDFDNVEFCGLLSIKGKLGNSPLYNIGTTGFGLTCGVIINHVPKIWVAQITPNGLYAKAHFLDQVVKRIEYMDEDGNILALANTSIPTFLMFDPQGKMIWQYQTKTTENFPEENVMITEIKDGYVIAYYSSDIYAQATDDYNLLNVSLEKIDRQGKMVGSNNLKEPFDKNAQLLRGDKLAEKGVVQLWPLQDGKFALSISSFYLDEDGYPNRLEFIVNYPDSNGSENLRRGLNIQGDAAGGDHVFAVDATGKMIFSGYGGQGIEDWQTEQQLELALLDADGQVIWKQLIAPPIPPSSPGSQVGAICMLWNVLVDLQGNYVVICQPRYVDKNGWVKDQNYRQLIAYQFNQQGQQISRTLILDGEQAKEDLFFDSKGHNISVEKNMAFLQGKLLIGLTKPAAKLSRDQLLQVMKSTNPAAMNEALGIKMYQVDLPKK